MQYYLTAYLQDFYSFAQKRSPVLMYLFAGRVQVLQKENGERVAILNKLPESIITKEQNEMQQIFDEYWSNKTLWTRTLIGGLSQILENGVLAKHLFNC